MQYDLGSCLLVRALRGATADLLVRADIIYTAGRVYNISQNFNVPISINTNSESGTDTLRNILQRQTVSNRLVFSWSLKES